MLFKSFRNLFSTYSFLCINNVRNYDSIRISQGHNYIDNACLQLSSPWYGFFHQYFDALSQSCLHESHCPSLIFKYHIFDFSSLTHVFIRVCKRSGVTFDKQSIERLWTKGANITTTFGVVSKPRLPATLPSSISLESRPSLPDLCVSRLASRGSAVAAG